MSRLLILHCGHPKTGSSSLQRFLAENSHGLGEKGILYPVLSQPAKIEPLPWAQFQHGKVFQELLSKDGPGRKSRSRELISMLNRIEHEVLILSGENLFRSLFYMRRTEIWQFFAKLNYKIVTVTYLRDQAERLNSSYAQQSKMGWPVGSFDSFVSEKISEDNDIFGGTSAAIDYTGLLSEKLNLWGEHVWRPFSTDVKKAGIENDFLSTIEPFCFAAGTELPKQFVDFPRVNDADGTILVAITRALGEIVARRFPALKPIHPDRKRVADQAYRVANQVVSELALSDPKYQGLTADRRRLIANRFNSGNDLVAEKFWGRPWVKLFPPPTDGSIACNDVCETEDPEIKEAFERALPIAKARFLDILKHLEFK